MTGIFRSNNPLSTSLLFVYGLLLKLPWLLHNPAIQARQSDGFLYSALVKVLTEPFTTFPFLRIGVVYLLLFSQAIMLNHYATSAKLFSRPNYLVGMSYLLITSFFKDWNIFSAPLIVTSLLIWIIGRSTNLRDDHQIRTTLFNIGFVIGICSFIYFPSIAFLILVLLAVLISRPPRVNEWLTLLLGIFTLWYLLFSYLFLSNKLEGFRIPLFTTGLPDIQWNIHIYIGLGIVAFLMLVGWFLVQLESPRNTIQVRKRWMILFVGMIILIVLPMLGENENLAAWIVSISGIALFAAAAFFYINSKWIRFLLHWGTVAFILYYEYL